MKICHIWFNISIYWQHYMPFEYFVCASDLKKCKHVFIWYIFILYFSPILIRALFPPPLSRGVGHLPLMAIKNPGLVDISTHYQILLSDLVFTWDSFALSLFYLMGWPDVHGWWWFFVNDFLYIVNLWWGIVRIMS